MSDNSYYDSELKRWLKNGINKNRKNGFHEKTKISLE